MQFVSHFLRRTPIAPTAQKPVYIITSPYCTLDKGLTEMLFSMGLVKSAMPYDPNLASKFRAVFSEANFTVQRHLSARIYLERHKSRVQHMLRPLLPHLKPYDFFYEAPVGQTFLHPYIRKAIMPHARFIWFTPDRESWFADVEHTECSAPDAYPEYAQWEQNSDDRRALLQNRLRIERRKFIRLSRDFPQDCIEIQTTQPDACERLQNFTLNAAINI